MDDREGRIGEAGTRECELLDDEDDDAAPMGALGAPAPPPKYVPGDSISPERVPELMAISTSEAFLIITICMADDPEAMR